MRLKNTPSMEIKEKIKYLRDAKEKGIEAHDWLSDEKPKSHRLRRLTGQMGEKPQ